MYMKTFIYIISLRRNLILAFKGQIINLLSIIMCFDNVTNKQSAPSFSKTTLSNFQLKSDCLGRWQCERGLLPEWYFGQMAANNNNNNTWVLNLN